MKNLSNSFWKFAALGLLAGTLLWLPSCSDDDDETVPAGGGDPPVRYEEEVFSGFTASGDILYGSNVTQGGNQQDLYLKVYEPEGDTETNRPVLVYAHGGGFTSGTKEEVEATVMPLLTRSGYVVVSIQYRLIDVALDPLFDPAGAVSAFNVAGYDAASDMKAAVRFLKQNHEDYGIDTTNVFIGGYSAGAFTALAYAYVNSLEDVEAVGDSALTARWNAKGGVQGDSGNPHATIDVAGVVSGAGGMPVASPLGAGEPPLISFHSVADDVVPYGSGLALGLVPTEGSSVVHQEALDEGVTSTLVTEDDPNVKHEYFAECSTCYEQVRAFLFENLGN